MGYAYSNYIQFQCLKMCEPFQVNRNVNRNVNTHTKYFTLIRNVNINFVSYNNV